ncbi:unnamed protein product, partial [Ectocarpus sp. 8 AP-2014]
GVPARILCHGTCTGKDVTGAAICELHRRLNKVEKGGDAVVGPQRREEADVAGGQHVDTIHHHHHQQGREASSLASPVSDVTVIPSPWSENNQQQQQQQQKTFDAPVPTSLPPTSASGIGQILYSQNILEEIAVN